jgi:hypothetical protein
LGARGYPFARFEIAIEQGHVPFAHRGEFGGTPVDLHGLGGERGQPDVQRFRPERRTEHEDADRRPLRD